MCILISHVVFCALQLARYLNRTYWEKKQEEVRKSPTPSAPAPVPLAEPPMPISQPVETHTPVQPVNIVEVHMSHSVENMYKLDNDRRTCSIILVSDLILTPLRPEGFNSSGNFPLLTK